jgi:osmotically-inducible protein OsmY
METTTVLPESLADLDLEAEVTRAIQDLDILRPTHSEVNINVSRGLVTLTGLVPSIFVAREAERAVRAVRGVVDVSNQLVDDGGLTNRVAQALAVDPRTRAIPPGYRVTCFYGRVTLVGDFGDEQTHSNVVEVCKSVEGVRSVTVVSG